MNEADRIDFNRLEFVQATVLYGPKRSTFTSVDVRIKDRGRNSWSIWRDPAHPGFYFVQWTGRPLYEIPVGNVRMAERSDAIVVALPGPQSSPPPELLTKEDIEAAEAALAAQEPAKLVEAQEAAAKPAPKAKSKRQEQAAAASWGCSGGGSGAGGLMGSR